MGSFIFEPSCAGERRLGETVATGEFFDEDGVLASIALNVDEHENLYELEIWKVDFSSLKKWPAAEELVFRNVPKNL